MRMDHLLRILVILTFIAASIALSFYEPSLTGFLVLDENMIQCGYDHGCVDSAMINCTPSIFGSWNDSGDGSRDYLIIDTFNDSHCLIHYSIHIVSVLENISLDCRVRKGIMTDEEQEIEFKKSINSCNGTGKDFFIRMLGNGSLTVNLTEPVNGSIISYRGDLSVQAIYFHNWDYTDSNATFEVSKSGGPWEEITFNTYRRSRVGDRTSYSGIWNTSAADPSEASDLVPYRLRMMVNYTGEGVAPTYRYDEVDFFIDMSQQMAPVPAGDGYEPDNTFETAKEILASGDHQNRSFHVPGDVDYLYFDGSSGVRYTIATSGLGPGVNTSINLYDQDRNLVRYDDDSGEGPGSSKVIYSMEEDGRVYIRISNTGVTGGYHVTISRLSDNDADGFVIGFEIDSDCDDNDPVARPIAGGVDISRDLDLCVPGCYPSCRHYAITRPINITANGITIDCNGQTIKGDRRTPLFVVRGKRDITIKDCKIENFTTAVLLKNCNNCTIINSTIKNNQMGVHVERGIFTSIGSEMTFNDHVGVFIEDASRFDFIDSRADYNALEGINVQRSLSITINGSFVNKNRRNGLIIDSSRDIRIHSSTIVDNNDSGINMNGSNQVSISKSRLEMNRDGMVLFGGSGHLVVGNNITRNRVSGISLQEPNLNSSFRSNAIHSNAITGFKNLQANEVHATHNYWGTPDEGVIRGNIIDYYDNISFGKVFYNPWLAGLGNHSQVLYGKNWTECNDGIDNDGDGFIDHAGAGGALPDPNCVDEFWDSESNPPPGYIFEPEPNETIANDTTQSPCPEDWECTIWGECMNGQQKRTCLDRNTCGTVADRPDTVKGCDEGMVDRCSNGIWDTEEEGIDCGGPCLPCRPAHLDMPEGEEDEFPYILIAVIALMIAGIGGGGYWYYGARMQRKPVLADTNDEAVAYAQSSLLKGSNRMGVEEKLIEAGWSRTAVDDAMARCEGISDLRRYVVEAIEKGFTGEMIRSSLVNTGWDDGLVDMAVKIIDNHDKLERYLKDQSIHQKAMNMTWDTRFHTKQAGVQNAFGRPQPMGLEEIQRQMDGNPQMRPSMQQPQPSMPITQEWNPQPSNQGGLQAEQRSPGMQVGSTTIQPSKDAKKDEKRERKEYRLVEEDGRWVIKLG